MSAAPYPEYESGVSSATPRHATPRHATPRWPEMHPEKCGVKAGTAIKCGWLNMIMFESTEKLSS